MSTLEDWSTHLAKEVDEVRGTAEQELAPFWVRAYVAGGKQRKELFRASKPQAGAFGPPGAADAVLPFLFSALAKLGGTIIDALASTGVNSLLTIVNSMLAVYGLAPDGSGPPTDEATEDAGSPDAESPKDAATPIESNPLLIKFIDGMLIELEQVKILSDEERHAICLRVVRRLLEQPDGGIRFVRELRGDG